MSKEDSLSVDMYKLGLFAHNKGYNGVAPIKSTNNLITMHVLMDNEFLMRF